MGTREHTRRRCQRREMRHLEEDQRKEEKEHLSNMLQEIVAEKIWDENGGQPEETVNRISHRTKQSPKFH